MSILTPIPPATSLPLRLLFAVPLLGWIARDVAFGTRDNVWYAATILATVWLFAILEFGLAAIVVPYVCAVPAAFAVLIRLAWG